MAAAAAVAQTALIALHGHPTLGTPGLTLLQSAREIKFTLGGLDR